MLTLHPIMYNQAPPWFIKVLSRLPQGLPNSSKATLVLNSSEGKTQTILLQEPNLPLFCQIATSFIRGHPCACVFESKRVTLDILRQNIEHINWETCLQNELPCCLCPQSSNQDVKALTGMSLSSVQQAPMLDWTAAVHIHGIYQFTVYLFSV